MRKAKSLKNISFRKYGEVTFGDITLPIRTLSISEEINAQITFPNDIPKKLERPTEAMKEHLTKADPKYNTNMYPMIRVYDVLDVKYVETTNKIQRYGKMLEALKYIDFDASTDEEGKISLWQDIGIVKGDWFKVCEFFEEKGFGSVEFELIINKAKALSGETLFERLGKIQDITKEDMFTIIMKLEALSTSKEDKIKETEYITKIKEVTEAKELENIQTQEALNEEMEIELANDQAK